MGEVVGVPVEEGFAAVVVGLAIQDELAVVFLELVVQRSKNS